MNVPHITWRKDRKESVVLGKKIVYEVPVAQTSTVTESHVIDWTLDRPGLVAEAGASPQPLGIRLPRRMRFVLVPGSEGLRLEPADAKFIDELSKAVDEQVTDAILAPRVSVRTEGLRKEIDDIARALFDERSPGSSPSFVRRSSVRSYRARSPAPSSAPSRRRFRSKRWAARARALRSCFLPLPAVRCR